MAVLTKVLPSPPRYTIHKQDQVFSIETKLVCFQKRNDAVKFASLIEGHHALTREWPLINYDDVLYTKNFDGKLKYTSIEEWESDTLKMYCKENLFNMLDVDHLYDGFKIKGSVIQWTNVPPEFYVEYLHRLSRI